MKALAQARVAYKKKIILKIQRDSRHPDAFLDALFTVR